MEEELGLNLYRVTRSDNPKNKWDIYSSFIVCCDTEQEAREAHPNEGICYNHNLGTWSYKLSVDDRVRGGRDNNGWVSVNLIDTLEVEFIGRAKASIPKGEVIMSEFHSG